MTDQSKPDYAALAERAVSEGNVPTVPSTLYFTYKRTDGDSFVAPASSAEAYLRKGYTITGEQTIDSFAAWVEEQSAQAQAASTTAKTSTTAKASTSTTSA
jgi:hypothetical protein